MTMSVKIATAVAAAPALLVGAVMVFIAFQHNPQGEAFDPQTGAVAYGYVAALFASWSVATFVCVAAVEAALLLIRRAMAG
jgi:fructose-specific phosphotransferase system IIC component